jgi:hypothetical protein
VIQLKLLFSSQVGVSHLRGGVNHAGETRFATNEVTWLEKNQTNPRLIYQSCRIFTCAPKVVVGNFVAVHFQNCMQVFDSQEADLQSIASLIPGDKVSKQLALFISKFKHRLDDVMESFTQVGLLNAAIERFKNC